MHQIRRVTPHDLRRRAARVHLADDLKIDLVPGVPVSAARRPNARLDQECVNPGADLHRCGCAVERRTIIADGDLNDPAVTQRIGRAGAADWRVLLKKRLPARGPCRGIRRDLAS